MAWASFPLVLFLILGIGAESAAYGYYDAGSPTLKDIWVDPVNGNDANSGESEAKAFKTISQAWSTIPNGSTFTETGYRIMLAAGTYPGNFLPNYMESRYGTYQFPVIIQAASGPNTVLINGGFNIYDCRYLYLIDLNFYSPDSTADVVHIDHCSHILIRRTVLDSGGRNSQECLKVNQTQYIYLEENDISGAWDNAVDFVAVQYGNIINNRIHNSGDWCMYTKGGSAYLRIEGNELYDCGTGGYTAGQGTGFQFMSSPWLHYEAYDIKAVNNIIHDTQGAGLGVNGGYNILMAYNTLYRVGITSHLLEVGFGSRSCDGHPGDPGRDLCGVYKSAGGWGTEVVDDGTNFVRIPNKNIFIYNNIIYNPQGYQSGWQHFTIFGTYSGSSQTGSNVALPTLADDNIKIRGNVIWNGTSAMPLGVEEPNDGLTGCQPANATCNRTQLIADNAINTIEPQLADPANGKFHPVSGANLFNSITYAVPDFTWSDSPASPAVPAGNLSNNVATDRDGRERISSAPPGAYSQPTLISCALSNLTTELKIHVPVINFNNIFYAAVLDFVPSTDGVLWFKLVNAVLARGECNNPATLSQTSGAYILHIPELTYNTSSYIVDLQYVPSTDSNIMFKVVSAATYRTSPEI